MSWELGGGFAAINALGANSLREWLDSCSLIDEYRAQYIAETGSIETGEKIMAEAIEYAREYSRTMPISFREALVQFRQRRAWDNAKETIRKHQSLPLDENGKPIHPEGDMQKTVDKAMEQKAAAQEAFGVVRNSRGQLVTYNNGGEITVHNDASDSKFTNEHRAWFKEEKQRRARVAENEKARAGKSAKKKARKRIADESRKRNRRG